jgi:hypothetical protein
MCYQIFVIALSGTCLNALVCGSLGELFTTLDNTNVSSFNRKMSVVDTLISYRKLDSSIRSSIVGQFEYVWMTERQSGGNESNIMQILSPSLAGELAMALRSDILKNVPCFKLLNPGRISRALRPQVKQLCL